MTPRGPFQPLPFCDSVISLARRARFFLQATEQAMFLLLCLDPRDLVSFDSSHKSYSILHNLFHKVLVRAESDMPPLSLKLT